MLVQLRCPLQAERITTIPYGSDHTRVRFFLRFYPERVPSQIGCAAVWRSADGQNVLLRTEHIENPAPGTAPGLYEISMLTDGKAPEGTPVILFTRVQFPDGTIWSDPDEELTEMPAIEPLSAGQLEWLRSSKGEGDDAVCASLGTETGWLCICGHWNLKRRRECARCSRPRDAVLSLYGSERIGIEYEREEDYRTDFVIRNVTLPDKDKRGRKRRQKRGARSSVSYPLTEREVRNGRRLAEKRKRARAVLITVGLILLALFLRVMRLRIPG